MPNTNETAFEGSFIELATLHVPDSSIDSYKGTAPWSGFKNVMPFEVKNTYSLSITSTGGGHVSYSGNTINEATKTFTVNGGASAKLSFTPNNDYKIGSVKVNGNDVTSSISNNTFVINAIDSNTSVEVLFEADVPAIDIEKYITAYNTGGAFMQTNDLLNSGSQLNWAFNNNNSVSVTLKNMQLIDGKTGSEGNVMSVNQLVEAESSVAYSVTIGASGIHIPVICRFRYDYNGKEYVVDAIYNDTYSLSIEVSGKGTAIFNGATVRDKTSEFEVRKGNSVTISFTPDNGQRVKSLKVNNVDVTSKISNNQYTIGYFSNNTTVSVTFETIPNYTLDVTSTGSGYVTYSGTTINGSTKSFTVAEGASATLTFTPNTGYKVASVKVNGSDVTSSVVDNKYTISNIDGNTNVSVTFKVITYSLDITSTGGGYVTCANTTINGTTKSFTYDEGASAVLTFTPNSGYRIKSVKVNNVDVISNVTDNKYIISSINKNTIVEVTFEEIPRYTLSITSLGGGYVTYSTNTISNAAKAFTLDEGASATLTFTPNSGYQILSLKVNNVDVTSSLSNNQYTINSIGQNTTVSVAFGEIPPTTYSLSITSSSGGYVTYSNYTIDGTTKTYTVNEGTSATLTFIPNNGYRIKNVKVNDVNITNDITDNQYKIDNITQDTRVDVVYERSTYSLAVASLGNGSVSCAGENVYNSTMYFTYDEGASATLTISPEKGYRVKLLTVNGVDVTNGVVDNQYTIRNVNMDTRVSVTFEAITHRLPITSSGGGFVTYSVATIRGTTRVFTVNEGASALLTITPDKGYRIKRVSINNKNVTNDVIDNQYTINSISQDTEVVVVFEQITYSLKITSIGKGIVTYSDNTISSGTTETYIVNEGSSALLTLTPNSGYRIGRVEVNGEDVTSMVSEDNYTIDNISQNITVSVTFESIPTHTLIITSLGTGFVVYSNNTVNSTTKSFNVDEGSSVTLEFNTVSGYHVGSLLVNNVDVTSGIVGDQYTIENYSQTTTVRVSFEAIPPTTYTLSITSSGEGFVSYSTYEIAEETKTFSISEGTSALLTITPKSGYRVGSLKINGADITPYISSNKYTINDIQRNITVIVTFEAIPPTTYSLSITSSGNGNVRYSGKNINNTTQNYTINEGAAVFVSFIPNSGCRVKSVSINGEDVMNNVVDNQYTINNINQDTKIEVVFEPITYLLTISSLGYGKVLFGEEEVNYAARAFTVNEGSSAELVFQPDGGYRIKLLTVNGTDVTSDVVDNKYTVSNIDKNTTVVVTFEEKVIPDGSMVMYKDVNYRVLSGKDKTVTVANGEYTQSLDIPATIAVNDMTLNVRGIESNVMTDNPQLAAVIWNPAVKFDAKVSNPNFLLYVTSAEYAPSGIKNVIVNGTANSITLTDADVGNDFYCPKAFAARSISYTHNYSMITGIGECRGWETIALPFNVQKIAHSEKGQVVPFAVWQKGETHRPFWLYELTENGWKEAGAIKAYTPYVISMPNNELYYESSCLNGQVTFSAENVAVEATTSHKVSYNGKTFVPNFSVRESGGYVYALNVKNDWTTYNGSLTEGSHFVLNLRTVHPFEAYMTTENNSRAEFSIFDADATEVQGVKMLLDQRKIKGVYNLNGQKLDEDNDKKLPAGVYIIGGQKVMVK